MEIEAEANWIIIREVSEDDADDVNWTGRLVRDRPGLSDHWFLHLGMEPVRSKKEHSETPVISLRASVEQCG